MIERICETCGKLFQAKPYSVRKGQARFCSLKCWGQSAKCHQIALRMAHYERTEAHRKAISERSIMLFKRKPKSEDHKRKIGEANKGRKRPDFALIRHKMTIAGRQRGVNNPNYGKHHSEETRGKIRQKHLAYIARTPIDERRLSEEIKRKLSEIRKRDWQNPEYVAKLIKAMGLQPNKLEEKLIDLLTAHFPQFKYNGDFGQGVMLGGLTPDFVNVNGKKQVIEVFGDYWHSPEIIGGDWRRSELGKITIYNSVGWDCLVIWQHELEELTEEEIVKKISDFSKRRLKCPV